MRRASAYLILFVIVIAGAFISIRGCHDPTEQSVRVTSSDPKQSQVSIDASDVTLILNADNTDIRWTGSNAAGLTPYGYFYELSGKAVVDGTSGALKAVDVVINMDSVKAMDASLTEKLKHQGFFEVDQFETSRFESTSVSEGAREGDPEGTTHVLEGNLQLRDATRSIQIPVAMQSTPDRLKLISEFSINRKDYGVVYSNKIEDAAIRDGVLLNIDLEVTRE